jgi:hypothetical protein
MSTMNYFIAFGDHRWVWLDVWCTISCPLWQELNCPLFEVLVSNYMFKAFRWLFCIHYFHKIINCNLPQDLFMRMCHRSWLISPQPGVGHASS